MEKHDKREGLPNFATKDVFGEKAISLAWETGNRLLHKIVLNIVNNHRLLCRENAELHLGINPYLADREIMMMYRINLNKALARAQNIIRAYTQGQQASVVSKDINDIERLIKVYKKENLQ